MVVRCLEDTALIHRLRNDNIPLTVCPLSNIKLNVFDNMKSHSIKQLLNAGLNVSIHSDDPAYFGCLNDNYFAIIDEFQLGIDENDIIQLATNAINSSFLSINAIICLDSNNTLILTKVFVIL